MVALRSVVGKLSLLSVAHAFKHLEGGGSQLDPNRIICPVLAAMYNAGDLRPDVNGSLELEEIKAGLMDGLWTGESLAEFQAVGIADYDLENKDTELHRDRCLPFTLAGTACAAKRAAGYSGDSVKRWLNIFTMNGKQAVEHGYSTGVRGGATNVPDLSDSCNGIYPCEDRFQKFYVQHADENGRFYLQNILEIICHARSEGDRGGEFSYNTGLPVYAPGLDALVPARDWQIKAAMTGWLTAFGRTDDGGDLYLTVDDARAMLMEGRYPDGWQKRSWGCLFSGCSAPGVFVDGVTLEMPCNVEDSWWQGSSSCEAETGETCHLWCNGGASCISGKCICGLGSNGVAMCAKDGECIERSNTCTYFGESCQSVAADNPSAPMFASHSMETLV